MTKLEIVKERLYKTNASLVVLYTNGDVKDKVIGKAAASLLTVSGVQEIYADTISEYGKEVLDKNNIVYEYRLKTNYIQNNAKTGMCPMEEKFKDENDLEVIYEFFLNKEI